MTFYHTTDDQYRESNDYRFSKGALGLLTKVYATWAGYPVKDESNGKLLQNRTHFGRIGKHGLLKDYEQLWKNTVMQHLGPD